MFFQTVMFNFRVKQSDKRRGLHIISDMQKISHMVFFKRQGAYVLEDLKINCYERKLYIFEQPFLYTSYLDERLLGLVD